VKNITDYGAFIDMGGVDGLLHVTDISWKRISHPAEVLQIGQQVKVKVIKYNTENRRVSLGMKQLEPDPWASVEGKYIAGQKVSGVVTNIADYGAFVELEPAIEGLIHVSEMSWTKKNVHPSKILSSGQEIKVMVIEVDVNKRRIALGIKQCTENPWERIVVDHPVGSSFEGEIRNVTEFGLFVAVSDDLDGMVHMSDLSGTESADEAIKSYKKGDKITVKVLEIDPKNERVALGVKQLQADTFEDGLAGIKKGDVVTCEIVKIIDAGLEVIVNDSLSGFIRKTDLAKDRSDQRPDRFAVGEKVDARITIVDRKTRSLSLSIKAREIQEEREAMEAFGSVDSGASLGDILNNAFDKAK
ncbi:MAG: S1 RNA-binding domain-containing protein, partial [Bacteroidota bacterium]